MSRNADRAKFLSTSGWTDADIRPLAGDASARRYFRIRLSGRSAVLMDAGDDPSGSLDRFFKIGAHLQDIGLHPPAVLSADCSTGFLLLEDLGDDLFARIIEHDATSEIPLYQAAIAVLSIVQNAPAPNLPVFDASVMAEIAGLAASAYADRPQEAETLTETLRPILDRIAIDEPVMVMRDFHAENLVFCPQARGPMQVGLLDFQDAVMGHPVYDIVSLLQDARRDVSPGAESSLKAHAQSLPNWEDCDFEFAYALLGAQRSLRILGVFARLSLEHGKPDYIDLIPRVWRLLERNLQHPALAALDGTIRRILPAPDIRHLNDLKARCQKIQTH